MTHFPSTTPIPWGHLSPKPNFSSHTPSDCSLSSSTAYSTSSPLPRPRFPPDRRARPKPLLALFHAPEHLPPPRQAPPPPAPTLGPGMRGRHLFYRPSRRPRPGRDIPPHIDRSLRERGLRRTTSDPLVPPLLAAPGELECGVASRVPRGAGVRTGSPPHQLVPIVGVEGEGGSPELT